MLDVDTIQLKLASRLRFHVLAFICLGIIYIRGAWNTYGVLFLAGDTGSTCDVGIKKSMVKHVESSSVNHTIQITDNANKVSEENSLIMATKCEVIVSTGNGSNASMPCTYGWVYGRELESTQVAEWDLVCVRAYMLEQSTTLFIVGSMLGALLITPLSDKFGRRPVLMICLLIQAVVGSCVAWSPNYSVFTILRFIVGFFNMGIALCAFVMMTEIFPAQYRTIPCLVFQTFWACGIMFTAFFGYVVHHWHHLQLAISLPNILCALSVWILPESLPWLISQNKLSRAQKVIETISKFNCMNVPSDLLVYESLPLQHSDHEERLNQEVCDQYVIEQPLLSEPGTSSERNFRDSSPTEEGIVKEDGIEALEEGAEGFHNLITDVPETTRVDARDDVSTLSPCQVTERFRYATSTGRNSLKNVFYLCLSPRIRLYTLIIFYLFFVNSLSYFGISLSTPILHRNQFLNLFLLGAVEIPAYFACVVVCARVGRKIPLMMFLLVCGLLNIIAMLISEQASSGMSIARIVLVMASKFSITGAYATVYLYAAEIFPTPVRNHAVGVASFFENLGSMAAPFIVFAAKSLIEMPMVLFGILCVGGSMMVFAMPETQGQPLPQTASESESLGMCKRRRQE